MAASDLKMRLVVNASLKMSPGKIAAQVGHAVSDITEQMCKADPKMWRRYKSAGHAKVVLRASRQELELLAQLHGAFTVRDEGRTEVDPGSLTVVGFAPNSGVDLRSLSLL